jgi:ubiquitin-conjugating enzyme E2 Z
MATTLTTIAIKRICSDMKDLNRHPLEDEGIFHFYDETNMQNCRIMMIGPEDTPYEGGFYLFHFTFPSNYPFEPPKVKYCTQGNNIRFNPNLYTCGKVCLSLINTWEGPKWTSCQTIRSVLISLRGLVLGVKFPLQNEPGYETAKDTRATGFNDVITHENYRTAVVGMMSNPPPGFEIFVPQMVQYVAKNYSTYEKKITELSALDNTNAVSPVYNMSVKRNFRDQLTKIKQILEGHGIVLETSKKTKNILVSEDDYSDEEDQPTMEKKLLAKLAADKAAKELADKAAKELADKAAKEIADKAAKELADKAAKKLAMEEKAAKKIADKAAKQLADKAAKELVVEAKAAKKAGDLVTLADKIVEIVFSSEPPKKKPAERKSPKEPAKNYEVGHKMNGLDGKLYVVKSIGLGTTKYNRWFSTTDLDTVKETLEVDNKPEVAIGKPEVANGKEEAVDNKPDEKSTEEKKKPVRRAPKQAAKDHAEGFELVGEDQKMYVVKTIGSEDKKSFKRWVLKK